MGPYHTAETLEGHAMTKAPTIALRIWPMCRHTHVDLSPRWSLLMKHGIVRMTHPTQLRRALRIMHFLSPFLVQSRNDTNGTTGQNLK